MSNAYSVPSYQQILQSAINNYQQMATYFGYNISITPTDELYIRLSTYASLVSVLYQYDNQLTNANIIDTATGSNLDRVGNFLGFIRRTALSSQGAVTLVASQNQTLITGTLLTGPTGLTFQVQYTGVYANGQAVNVVCVNTGANTNINTGSIMTWQAPTGTMQSSAIVTVACTGGVDAEDDETFRNRIYLAIQSPPGMGNATQVITTSASVDNIIQQAFTYANFNGAGTQLIALTGYQTNSYIGRDIPHLPYDGYVSIYGNTVFNPSLQLQTGATPLPGPNPNGLGFGAYNQYTLAGNNFGQNLASDSSAIYGQLPATVANPFATVITTVNNIPSQVNAVLTLPYPVGASPNGLGGGWLNATPWPVPDGFYVQDYCSVVPFVSAPSVAYPGQTQGPNSATCFTISAPSGGAFNTSNPNVSSLTYTNHTPVLGQTQIQWINRSDANQAGWQVVTATVMDAYDNGNNTWTITLSVPFAFAPGTSDFYGNTGLAIGDFISPAATNGQTYLNNILAGYAVLGPGEVTSNQGLIALGAARYPSGNTSFSETLGAPVEKILEVNNEVFSAELSPGPGSNVVGAGIVYNCYNTAYVSPTNNAPPSIWVPWQIGWEPNESWNFGT